MCKIMKYEYNQWESSDQNQLHQKPKIKNFNFGTVLSHIHI